MQHTAALTPLAHWTAPRLAAHVGVSPSTVLRVWQRTGLQPDRLKRYVASTDPDFERKAADIIGLYLKPPQHAVVLCVDEKTVIQALDRLGGAGAGALHRVTAAARERSARLRGCRQYDPSYPASANVVVRDLGIYAALAEEAPV